MRTEADLGQRGTSNTRRDREASLDVEEFRANCLSPEYPDLGSTGLWLRRCFCGNELFWSRQTYLAMSLSKRCKMLGILLCEFGLDVVPKNCKTLAAQLLKLPERRTCFYQQTVRFKALVDLVFATRRSCSFCSQYRMSCPGEIP